MFPWNDGATPHSCPTGSLVGIFWGAECRVVRAHDGGQQSREIERSWQVLRTIRFGKCKLQLWIHIHLYMIYCSVCLDESETHQYTADTLVEGEALHDFNQGLVGKFIGKMVVPNKYPLYIYIRCIWSWLLRGPPSQGYHHHFPYDVCWVQPVLCTRKTKVETAPNRIFFNSHIDPTSKKTQKSSQKKAC